jgi:nitroreductase
MKKISLVLAVVLLTVANAFPADAIRNIMNRKSVRSFERAPISEKQIDTILKAGFAAPSGRDIRPWAFIVVNDFNVLDSLAEKLPSAKMLKEAGAAIIVCGKTDKDLFWITDCSAATENILLAVEALGLGAVWTAVYPKTDLVSSVKKTLNIPKEYTPLNVIPIGKPKGQNSPKNKYDSTKIHINKW